MSKKKQIRIKNPCHRTWDSLEGNGCERFCSSCSSNVVDLTNKSNSEIISLVLGQKGRVCGRIRQDQVDRILLQHKADSKLTKTFLIFVLGFATVTVAQATSTEQASSNFYEVFADKPIITEQEKNVNSTKTDTTYKITGRVLEATSTSGLPGVSVDLKGTSISTETNKEGRFTLTVPKGEVTRQSIALYFRLLGYRTTEIELPRKDLDNVEVRMELHTTMLGEIHIPWYRRFWWTVTSPFKKNTNY